MWDGNSKVTSHKLGSTGLYKKYFMEHINRTGVYKHLDKYYHSHQCRKFYNCRNFFISYSYNDDVKGDPPTCEEVL